ncbi:MAG: DUF2842 domain-containing protein [Hyphomicrobiaceae bacterium]
MSQRTRKFIGTILLTLFLTVYAFVAMLVAIVIQVRENVYLEVLYYIIAGLAWVLPAGIIVWWMQKPDPDAHEAVQR